MTTSENLFEELEVPVNRQGLNEPQATAYDKLISFVVGEDQEHNMMLLAGYAGTGKTFTISRVVKEIKRKKPGWKIAVSAPTHKAVKQLRKMGDKNVIYATIHSLLGVKPSRDEHTGFLKFEPDTNPNNIRINGMQVVIIDEVSMLEDDLYDMIKGYAHRIKIIFLGDPAQIPPVNHVDAQPLLSTTVATDKIGVSVLTEIVRQAADNPILNFATQLREHITDHMPIPVTKSLRNMHGIDIPDPEDIHLLLKQSFCSKMFQEDADYCKVLAWTNKQVAFYNKEIRDMLYGPTAESIEVGEKLILTAPYVKMTGSRMEIGLTNNEEIEVLDKKLGTMHVSYLDWMGRDTVVRDTFLPIWTIRVKYFEEEREVIVPIPILHPTGQTAYDQLLQKLRSNALKSGQPYRKEFWKSLFRLQDTFAWTAYNYALTVHKSQGSTYNYVFIVDQDICRNFTHVERNRIRYVAFTRARYTAFVI